MFHLVIGSVIVEVRCEVKSHLITSIYIITYIHKHTVLFLTVIHPLSPALLAWWGAIDWPWQNQLHSVTDRDMEISTGRRQQLCGYRGTEIESQRQKNIEYKYLYISICFFFIVTSFLPFYFFKVSIARTCFWKSLILVPRNTVEKHSPFILYYIFL